MKWLLGPLLAFLGRLRFPWLFGIFAAVFAMDVLVPDVLPFVDEIMIGIATIVLSQLRRRKEEVSAESRESLDG